jgi:hypothetical protein
VYVAHLSLLLLVLFAWYWHYICVFNFAVRGEGNLFLCAMVSIFSHSAFFISVVSGSDISLLIRCRYSAILCSVGWLEVKFIVVSVVVDLRYMLTSIFEGFLVINPLAPEFFFLILAHPVCKM